MESIQFTTVSTETEVIQILDLQALNLKSNLSETVQASQGFLTVQHEPAVLLKMNQVYPSAIAKDGDKVVGYCLMMPAVFRQAVPILEPMFAMLETLAWRGKPLGEYRWFVMGQVCVADGYRGKGIFDGMYTALQKAYAHDFDFVVTEIAARNARSIRAHERVGFQPLHLYTEALTGETWSVVIWDWSATCQAYIVF